MASAGALPAFASTAGRWASVFPSIDSERPPEDVERLSLSLARRLSRPVLTFFSLEGTFRYWLVDESGMVDAYTLVGDAAPVGGDVSRLLPLAEPGTTAADLTALLQERQTRLRRDTEGFIDEWKVQRAELRAHLVKNFKAGRGADLAALLREYDHHTSEMGAPPPTPVDMAADLGRMLGFADGLAWLDHAAILDGRAPLGSVVSLGRPG
ncbi:MAG: hypothetical protein JO102_03395 [Elusimicrobia bacterium]|nr:hypothetical protein [Elusimicrobiota bacterium]